MRAFRYGPTVFLAASTLIAACSSTPAPDAAADGAPAADASADIAQDQTTVDVPPGPLPDLTISRAALAREVQFTMQYFPPGSCEIAEGCVARDGWRRLLMFTTNTPNIGEADLNLGSSTSGNANFEYSTCHMHYHFRGYADYRLLGADGGTAALGHKQSFCVEDLQQVDNSSGIRTTAQFDNCGEAGGRQGISAGWADEYYPNLPCQWIDVTDVSPGRYTLHVEINTEHRFAEADYTNNTAEVPITIPASFASGNPLRNCGSADPDEGVGRDCGWRMEGAHACTPGDQISVGCNQDCGIGRCTGAWNVRICEGSTPCLGGDSVRLLQQDSGSCSTGLFNLSSTCGVATFVCPASGQYTVLHAPDVDGDTSSSCTLETRVTPSGDAGVAPTDGGSTDAARGD